MLEIKDLSKCCGCFSCEQGCPKGCIEMKGDLEGFYYPSVDNTQCINCGLCVKSCPILTPREYKKSESDIFSIAAQNKDINIRMSSSSGGFFTALASYVIDQDGVVFGAYLSDSLVVEHKYIDNKDDIKLFRGSKYVQSKIGEAYKQAEEFLKKGRLVLFTGTPCQVSGLLSYLKKEYDNLITQDVVCHGVPAPMVFKKYLDYQEKKFGSATECVVFRDKCSGWNTYSVNMKFLNNKKYTKVFSKDLYMRSFLRDYCLRPSCYSCKFKSKVHSSDFTLADYWGVTNIHPEFSDDKGTSLVLINSDNARKVFDCISEQFEWKETSLDKAIVYNPLIVRASKRPEERDAFMEDIQQRGYDYIKKKYFKTNYSELIYYFRSNVFHILVKLKNISKVKIF